MDKNFNTIIEEFRKGIEHMRCKSISGGNVDDFVFNENDIRHIEKFWLKKLKEKDQVINKLIEDRPFDIKDALAEKKKDNFKDIYNALLEQRVRLEEEFEATSKRNREIRRMKIEEIEEWNEPYCERDDFLLKRIKYRVIKII